MLKLLASILLFVLTLVSKVDATPLLRTDSLTVTAGSTFELPVTIQGATDLYAYQFDLTFNPSTLKLDSIFEGDFLATVGGTFFIGGTIDNSLGVASFTINSLLGPGAGSSGDGKLALFKFLALAPGISPIVIENVILLNSELNEVPAEEASNLITIQGTTPVPEPAAVSLIGLGFGALVLLTRLNYRR